ncbi:hypothetical protein SprV_0501907800 [Sparganum proliferum]
MLRAGPQKKESVFAEGTGTQHSLTDNFVCPDAGVEVNEDNHLIRLRHSHQECVQVLVKFLLYPGGTARRCISSCSFIWRRNIRVEQVASEVRATNLSGICGPDCTLYLCDSRNDRRFLIDTEADWDASPDLFLQATSASYVAILGTSFLSLDVGLRRLLPRVFVVADVSCTILVACDLLVNPRQSHPHDQITGHTAECISSILSAEFLGHPVDSISIHPLPSKVAATP